MTPVQRVIQDRAPIQPGVIDQPTSVPLENADLPAGIGYVFLTSVSEAMRVGLVMQRVRAGPEGGWPAMGEAQNQVPKIPNGLVASRLPASAAP